MSLQKCAKIQDLTPLKLVQMRRILLFLMECNNALENQLMSSSPKLVSAKLGTVHSWIKGIHVCLNEGPCLCS